MSQENPNMTSGLEEATRDFASRLSGKPASTAGEAPPPAPTPTPEETPAPEPTPQGTSPAPEPAPATPEPPAAAPAVPPATAQPEPPATAAPDLTDPAARRFLEMHGGNLDKALRAALDYNNRLGRFAREHPEAFRPGGAADPGQDFRPEDVVPFEEPQFELHEPEPVQLDAAKVQGTVDDRVYQDPEAMGLVQAYWANKFRLEGNPNRPQEPGLNHQIGDITQQIDYEQRKLNDPDFASDDLRKADSEAKILRLETRLGLLEGERSRRLTEMANQNFQFMNYRSAVERHVVDELTRQAEEEALTNYDREVEQAEETRVLKEWPSVLQRVITENNIPPEQVEDFSNDAAEAYRAALFDDNLVVDDLYGFLSGVGKRISARLDRYHRIRSGQYATAAATRAATPSPPTGPATGAPPPVQPKTTEEAIAEARNYYAQNRARLRTG
jgi:outer membrane biosynthesis protein TonB